MPTENLFSQLVDQLYDGVYFVDRSRRIIYWNKACERISGFKAEDVIGKRCSDNLLCHVDCQGQNLCAGRCPLHATMEDGEPREANVFLHDPEKQIVPVRVRTSPFIDETGQIVGGIEIFNRRPVTPRDMPGVDACSRTSLHPQPARHG